MQMLRCTRDTTVLQPDDHHQDHEQHPANHRRHPRYEDEAAYLEEPFYKPRPVAGSR
ncbi:hypothetical protein AB0I93_29340 [Streptomyces sp. NPDC049967]|uniref:hypothetical protein n=1 Tax=unclassified Streptomyces TaxID=2593676 RepID=UPI002E2B7004|nr:hypothetical protein [Streptomyces sp. NBC_00342]